MRPIKFRGKRLDNGEWVVGALFHIAGGSLIYFGSDTDTTEPDIERSNPIAVELFKGEVAVVDPETLGQFTGLHDKNGKEIYEGDIIEITDPNTNEKYISTVIWSRKGCYAAKIENNGNITLGYVDKSLIRIIGNIYDNPELISDKQ